MSIKTWRERCDEHPDHNGIVTNRMIQERMQEEIDELRQAIEQAEQAQPVAWQWLSTAHFRKNLPKDAKPGEFTPLYTASPQRKPLTNDELWELWNAHLEQPFPEYFVDFKRAAKVIEAAHGIRE